MFVAAEMGLDLSFPADAVQGTGITEAAARRAAAELS